MTDNLRLVVNASLCDGHGICVLRCPELIALDEWGFAGVEDGAVPDARLLRRARRAVAACPRRALTLVAARPAPAFPSAPHLVVVPRPPDDDPRDPTKPARVHNRSHGGG